MRSGKSRLGRVQLGLVLVLAVAPSARGLEHLTLKNGFELDCVRREIVGDKIRLYLAGNASSSEKNYLEIPADSVIEVEEIAALPKPAGPVAGPIAAVPTKEAIHQMLSSAGATH